MLLLLDVCGRWWDTLRQSTFLKEIFLNWGGKEQNEGTNTREITGADEKCGFSLCIPFLLEEFSEAEEVEKEMLIRITSKFTPLEKNVVKS